MTNLSNAYFLLSCEEGLPSDLFCPEEGKQLFWIVAVQRLIVSFRE